MSWEKRDALNAGRSVALPLSALRNALRNAGYDMSRISFLDHLSPDDWVTINSDDTIEEGITAEADVPAIGEYLRQC